MGSFIAQVMQWQPSNTKTPGRKAKLPVRCSLNLSAHFAVWVKLFLFTLLCNICGVLCGLFCGANVICERQGEQNAVVFATTHICNLNKRNIIPLT